MSSMNEFNEWMESIYIYCYGLNCVPPPKFVCWKSYFPVLQNVTVFGDTAFKEIIKVKWGQTGGVPIQ